MIQVWQLKGGTAGLDLRGLGNEFEAVLVAVDLVAVNVRNQVAGTGAR